MQLLPTDGIAVQRLVDASIQPIVTLEGFEPSISRFVVECVIQLRHRAIERKVRFELTFSFRYGVWFRRPYRYIPICYLYALERIDGIYALWNT